jgi:predicted RNase H-like nuclease
MYHSKKTERGFQERLLILQPRYPQSTEIVAHALKTHRRHEVARDDILDALAAAVTARVNQGRLRTIPEIPETDSRDLPMEIVY